MKYDFDLLKPLYWILKTKNLTEAAKILNIGQPSLSRSLVKARKQFRNELLVRSGNKFHLTDKGKSLLIQLNQLLPSIEALYTNEDLSLSSCERFIKIAGTDLDMNYVLEGILQARQSAPLLSVAIRQSHPNVLRELANAELDLVITAFDESFDGLHRKLVSEEPYVALLSKHHPCSAKEFTYQDYLSSKHGTFAFNESSRWPVDIALSAQGEKRKISLSLPSFSMIQHFLEQSDLVFSLPLRYAKKLSAETGTTMTPLPFKVSPIRIFLYWHHTTHNDSLMKWFRESLLANTTNRKNEHNAE